MLPLPLDWGWPAGKNGVIRYATSRSKRINPKNQLSLYVHVSANKLDGTKRMITAVNNEPLRQTEMDQFWNDSCSRNFLQDPRNKSSVANPSAKTSGGCGKFPRSIILADKKGGITPYQIARGTNFSFLAKWVGEILGAPAPVLFQREISLCLLIMQHGGNVYNELKCRKKNYARLKARRSPAVRACLPCSIHGCCMLSMDWAWVQWSSGWV